MSKYLNELIRDTNPFTADVSHTYMVYLKLEQDKKLNPNFELDFSDNINDALSTIFRKNVNSVKIICVKDTGVGINDKIVGIEYKGFTLIFAYVFTDLIFLNYFPIGETFPQNEEVCLHGIKNELKKYCTGSLNINGSYFEAINTHEPFIEFCRSTKSELEVDKNNSFWNDVKSYLDNNPRIGRYKYVQLGNKIIITSFEEVEEITWNDIISPKLTLPTEIRKVTENTKGVSALDDIHTQARCDSCGEFYHKDVMVGRYCFSCAEESDEEDEDYN